MTRFRRAGWLFGLLVLGSTLLAGQNSPQGFDTFLSKFRTAVAQKDQATLTGLMARHFDFIRAQNVPPAEVFSGLAANNGLQWSNLQQAAQGQPVPYTNSGSSGQALQCTPTEPIYSCMVIFQQDSQRRWRWKGMIMPTR